MSSIKVLLIKEDNKDNTLDSILIDSDYDIDVQKFSDSIFDQLATSNGIDIVIFNLSVPHIVILNAIRIINNEFECPVILFAEDSDQETINQVIKAGVSVFVVDGLRNVKINTIVSIAIARFQEQLKLKNELKKTKIKLEERKVVDRAKGILIKTRNLTEDEAYHTLRKLAMDRNIAIGEMAKNVISMEQLLNQAV